MTVSAPVSPAPPWTRRAGCPSRHGRTIRAIRAYDLEDGADSRIVEMMAGTFLISGFDPESGEETSLTKKQFDHWAKRFHS